MNAFSMSRSRAEEAAENPRSFSCPSTARSAIRNVRKMKGRRARTRLWFRMGCVSSGIMPQEAAAVGSHPHSHLDRADSQGSLRLCVIQAEFRTRFWAADWHF